MKNYRLLNVFLIGSICSLAAATASSADTRWSRTAPQGTRFSVEAPGELKVTEEGDQYLYIGLVVLSPEYEYTALAARPKGASEDDAKRFVRSFRLVTPGAERR